MKNSSKHLAAWDALSNQFDATLQEHEKALNEPLRKLETSRSQWEAVKRFVPAESAIISSGFVIDTLGAAFWRFLTTDNYRDAVLKAVNLGDDTDTTAAVTGAVAGLFYGLDAIPTDWLETLAGRRAILRLAGAMAWGLAA